MKTPFLKPLAIATFAITASFSANAIDLSQFSKQEVADIVNMCENNPSSVEVELCNSFEEFTLDDKADIDEGTADFEFLSATSDVDDVCEFDSNDKECD